MLLTRGILSSRYSSLSDHSEEPLSRIHFVSHLANTNAGKPVREQRRFAGNPWSVIFRGSPRN